MSGHIELNDAPPVMRDDEETIQDAKVSVGTVKKSMGTRERNN
jgi:hypothetical protein